VFVVVIVCVGVGVWGWGRGCAGEAVVGHEFQITTDAECV